MEPSAPTANDTTTATRSWASFNEVRSVDNRSGSIAKTRPGVYTEVVFWRAWASTGESRGTRASTSAIATCTRVRPSGSRSATVN